MKYAAIIAVLAALTSGTLADVDLVNATNNDLPSVQGFYHMLGGDPATWTANVFNHKSLTESTLSGYFTHDTVVPISSFPKAPYALSLDRNDGDGYTVEVTMQTVSETHGGDPNRAGFSLIALSSDSFGIELGFHTNKIFSQGLGFVEDDSIAIDTTSAMTKYSLSVLGNRFYLQVNDVLVWDGPLVNYTTDAAVIAAENDWTQGRHVYWMTDFVFVGDNTTSAGGEFNMGNVDVLDAAAVPEPATMLLLASGGAVALVRRRRKT